MAIQGRSYLRLANVRVAPAASAGPVTGTAAQTALFPTQSASGTAVPPAITGTAAQATPLVTQQAFHATTRYVTSVSANGRYFLDQHGSPILVRGDSPWSMLIDLSSSEMDTYLANRAAAGQNVLLCSLIGCVENGGGNNNGETYDGVLPFTSGDITTPNSTYWSRMDSYLSKAEALGITLLIYPLDGWNTKSGCVFAGKSDADCETFGDWLATRWLSRPNILWAFGGDYDASSVPGTFADSRFNACLTGIRAAGDNRLATIQNNYMRSLSSDSTYWEARADWNFGYSYFATYDVVLAGYAKSWSGGGKPSTRPVLFSEGEYDNSPVGDGGSAATIRRQAGWALTSGSPGAFTGQERVWSFETGSPAWTTRINSTQTAQFKAILDTFAALAKWHLLVPDTGSALVTAGRGTPYVFSSQSDNRWNSTSDYVTAAVTPDKSLAVIYNPDTSTRSITISASAVGANPTLRRVDPSTGTSTGMTWTTTPTASTNAAGARDWLFIIEADAYTGTAAQSALLPTQSASGTATPPAITGTAAQSALLPTQSASGTYSITGTAAQTTPVVTQAASGTYTPATVTGTAAQTVALVTQSADGTVTLPGSTGTAAQSTPLPTQTASGTATPPDITGTASQATPLPVQSATGTLPDTEITVRAYDFLPTDFGWGTEGNAETEALQTAVEFYVTATAWARRLWWWNPPTAASSSTRVVTLWRVDSDASGTLLYSADSTPPGTGQWVFHELPEPIELSPSEVYRAGVIHPAGGYPATPLWYSTGDGDPTQTFGGLLVIPSSAEAIGSDQNSFIYNASSSTFPLNSFNQSNYWTDVTVTNVAPVAGTAAQVAPLPAQSASGTAVPPAITGTASQTTPRPAQSAVGTTAPPEFSGTASQTTPAVTQTATGTYTPAAITGTAAQSTPQVQQTAGGSFTPPVITGAAAQMVPLPQQTASGIASAPGTIEGTAAQLLLLPVQTATGTFDLPVVTGSAAQTTPVPVQVASGTRTVPDITGTAVQTIPFPVQYAFYADLTGDAQEVRIRIRGRGRGPGIRIYRRL